MLETFVVFAIGLAPPIISVYLMRQAEARARSQLRQAMERATLMPLRSLHLASDLHYVETIGGTIGDISCCFNARSSYLRCAVNPQGPCEGCPYYQQKD